MAYMAYLEDKMVMVVSGDEKTPFDAIGRPHFSPDSHTLAYTVLVDDNWGLCVNGVVTENRFTGFMATIPLVYDSDTSLHGLALKEKPETEFFRFEVGIDTKG